MAGGGGEGGGSLFILVGSIARLHLFIYTLIKLYNI